MRKAAIILVAIVVVGLIGGMVILSVKKLAEKESRKTRISSIPSITLTELSGNSIKLKEDASGNPLVLILFNSECEHCQYEAETISNNLDRILDIKVIFLSAEEIQTIQSFAETYGLLSKANVIVGQVDYLELSATFDSFSYPNIFIYGKNGGLLKEFKGETKIEAILEVLESNKSS